MRVAASAQLGRLLLEPEWAVGAGLFGPLILTGFLVTPGSDMCTGCPARADHIEDTIAKMEVTFNLAAPFQRIRSGNRCMTARQGLSRQGVGLASPDNSDTPGRSKCEPEPVGWARNMQRGCGVKLQATPQRLRWRTGDVKRRRR
jgi:hypothetical protein